MTYETPVFNPRAVARETGVKPSTLRAWERRYGLPQPERTEGGHRLYSQRDIDLIKWLLARQQEGMRIKSAVELWRQLEDAGQESLRPVARVPQAATPPEGTIAELRQAWTSACLAFDERGAEQVLTQAFALYPPETVSLELLQRGLAQLGEGWFRGEVTVQQEHFASTLATRRLDALVESTPPPTRPGRILTACSPQERHAFSLLLLTFLLRRWGWDVLFLGADVPTARLETALATTRPQLVILAAQQLHTAATLKEMAQLLRREHIPVGYGGRIFNLAPALRQRIPGHFLGHSVAAAPLMVEQLMGAPHPVPPIEPSSEAHRQALAHFRERQPLIEVHLLQTLALMGIAHDHLVEANKELAGNIAAALSLGDVSLLGIYFDWLEGVCSGDRLPAQLCAPYLQAYYRSAKAHLDGRGALITDWLARRIEQRERS